MHHFELATLFSAIGMPGTDLLLREYGQQAFPFLKQALLETPPGGVLVLEFSGVRVMDTSFADETVVELAVGLNTQLYDDRFLVLHNPGSATIDNLEGTLARRKPKVTLLILEGESPRILGHIEENLLETWQLVITHAPMTARQLADELHLEINTASTRLLKLYERRMLVRQEIITGEGRQFQYGLPG
jgi:hypothetical protein